ncbi:unnamed protein product, partial [Tenebrio molitor]
VNKETTHFSLYFALVFGHQCFGTFGMLPVTGITGENSIQFSNISLGFQMNCLLVGICWTFFLVLKMVRDCRQEFPDWENGTNYRHNRIQGCKNFNQTTRWQTLRLRRHYKMCRTSFNKIRPKFRPTVQTCGRHQKIRQSS